jgi:hypothetical protein
VNEEIAADTWLVLCQSVELASDAAMRFGLLFRSAQKCRPRQLRVVTSGTAAAAIVLTLATMMALAEVIGGFGIYRSSPSCRTSCMNRALRVRSGAEDITAPVSSRISVVRGASRRISSPRVPGSLMKTAMS